MGENEQAGRRGGKGRRILLYGIAASVLSFVAAFAALSVYLASPQCAARLSRFLSSYLHQEVSVARLGTSGSAITVRGFTLANPPGFPRGNLLRIDSLSVAPRWSDFASGRQGFHLLALSGVSLDVLKNSRGEWNYARLQRSFAGKKPSATETVIDEVRVRDAAVSVNGQTVRGIALELHNLTSKGSRDSGVDLSFHDAWRNRYAIKGRVRGGAAPDLDLSLTGEVHSFDPLAPLLPPQNRKLISGGSGTLQMHGLLHRGEVTTVGSLHFRAVKLSYGTRTLPLTGSLSFAGGYHQKEDALRVERLELSLQQLGRLRGAGTVQEVRRARRFAAEVTLDQMELARLASFLPDAEAGRTRLGGSVTARGVRLTGSAAGGLTGASGTVTLAGARLQRDGRSILSGVDGTIALSKSVGGVAAKGRLVEPHAPDALVQELDAPFDALLSRRLKLLEARITLRSARVAATDLGGTVRFDAASPHPYTFDLKAPAAQLSAFNPFLGRYRLNFSSGSAALAVDGAGRSAADFDAAVAARLSGVQGVREGKPLAVAAGVVESRLERKGGELSAAGTFSVSGANFAGTAADAASAFRVKDGVFQLEKGSVKALGASLTFASLSGRLPAAQQPSRGVIPLSLDLAGGELVRGGAQLQRLSAAVRGRYRTEGEAGWLDGTASLATGSVLWQGKELGAPSGRFTMGRSAGRGELGGTLFGGSLSGELSFDPRAPQGARFLIAVAQGRAAALAPFLPQGKGSPTLSQGAFDATCNGSYSRSAGLACRLQGKATGVNLASGSKTFLAGGGLALDAALAGEKLSIAEAVISAGQAVKLRVQGEVQRPFSQERNGALLLSLPRTALNDLIDPFVNLLPRMVQEANVSGQVAAQGRLALFEGRQQLDGSIDLADLRFEVPSQKVILSGVNGAVPVSLDFSGKTVGKLRPGLSVSKENYPRLLQQMRELAVGKPSVTAGTVSFGTLELGSLKMQLAAKEGITEIKSVESTIYGGAMLGKGTVSMQKGGSFRTDLFLNDVSLKELCRAIPGITGYISGKIDGFVSLNGSGKGVEGLTGFVDLWARKGKGEKMVVSKRFLQRLSGEKLKGLILTSRPYDRAEIMATLEGGDLSFQALDIVHTNLVGVRDLNVSIAATQNRISLDHLFTSIKEAAVRGKTATGQPPAEAPAAEQPAAEPPAFKWEE